MSHVGAVNAHLDTATTTYTLNPAGSGYAAGDLLVLAVACNNTGGITASVSGSWGTPTTFTANSMTVNIYTKTAVASEPIITITHSAASRGASFLEIRRGETVVAGSYAFTADANSASSPVAPSGSLTAGRFVCHIPVMRSSSWVAGDTWASSPAGFTKRADSIAIGNGSSGLSFWERSTAGAWSATTYTTTPTAVTTNAGGVVAFQTTTAAHTGTFGQAGDGSTGASNGGNLTALTAFLAKHGAKRTLPAVTSGNTGSTQVSGTKGSAGAGGHIVDSTDFESGTLNASVPTNGTDFYNGGNVVGTGTATYTGTHTHNGARAMRLQTPVSTDQANRVRTFTAQGIFLFRGYLYMNALPTNAAWIALSLLSGATTVAQLRIATTGIITCRDGGTAVGATTTLAAGTMYRIEWKVDPDPTTGTQELRIWNQSNLEGAIANYDFHAVTTATSTAATTVDSFADSAFGTAIVDAIWDDVAFGDTDWIGSPQAAPPAFSDTILLSGGNSTSMGVTGVQGQANVVALSGGNTAGTLTGTKAQGANASVAFSSFVDVTLRKDANATFADSNGGNQAIFYTVTIPERHFGSFSDLNGGQGSFAGHKQATHVVAPALSGGNSAATAASGRKGGKGALGATSGGTTSSNFSGFSTRVGQTSFSLSGGGGFTATVRTGRRQPFATEHNGGAFTATIRKTAKGGISEHGGATTNPTWTGTSAITIGGNVNVALPAVSGGGDFVRWNVPAVGWVLLEWNVSVDDHPRPHWNPLWRRVRYPHTRYGLLVYRDGRVIETPTLERIEEWDADLVISGLFYAPADDWAAVVLSDAGYTLVSIDATSGLPGVPSR